MNERMQELMNIERRSREAMQIARSSLDLCRALEDIDNGNIVAIRLYRKDDEHTGGYYVDKLTGELLEEISVLLKDRIDDNKRVAQQITS